MSDIHPLEASVHDKPEAHSHMERACAINNVIVRAFGMPESWLVDFATVESNQYIAPMFGVHNFYSGDVRGLEGYMIGLALASRTITISKAREFLGAAGFRQNVELSDFGGAVRDSEHADPLPPGKKRRWKDGAKP